MSGSINDILERFEEMITKNKVVYFSKPGCSLCVKLDEYLIKNQINDFVKIDLYEMDDDEGLDILDHLKNNFTITTFPICFVESKFVGTFGDMVEHFDKKNTFSQTIDDV